MFERQGALVVARRLDAIENGNGRSAHDVIAALRALGQEVRFPFLEKGDSFSARWKRFWQRRFMKRRPLVVVNGLGSARLLEQSAKKIRNVLPDVIIVRESPVHYEILGQDPLDQAAIMKRFTHRVFVSSIARDKWISIGVPAENSHYLPNTLDRASPESGEAKAPDPDLELLAEDRLNVLVVGSFQRRKAQDLVVDTVLASAELSRRFRFVFIGELKGDYAAALVEKSRGSDSLLFVGQKRALGDWYRRADAVLQPSRAEAMSRVMLEALKCGTPFVCTDIEGAGEVVRDGIDGLLFPVDDSRALEATLMRLSDSDTERREFGLRGQTRFRETYDWPRYVERWRQLLPLLLVR